MQNAMSSVARRLYNLQYSYVNKITAVSCHSLHRPIDDVELQVVLMVADIAFHVLLHTIYFDPHASLIALNILYIATYKNVLTTVKCVQSLVGPAV